MKKLTLLNFSLLIGLSVSCQDKKETPEPFEVMFPEGISTQFYTDRTDKGTLTNTDIDEASGLIVSQNIGNALWTHNDSGDQARIFLLQDNGTSLNTFTLEGATNTDWEDMAIARHPANAQSYIYVADIGDNNGVRDTKTIYRFAEPTTATPVSTVIPAAAIDKIQFRYPDGNKDAETIWIDSNGDIYIVAKTADEIKLYLISYPQSVSEITTSTKVVSFPITFVVFQGAVGGSVAYNTGDILLKFYDRTYYWKRPIGKTIAETITTQSPVRLPYTQEPQGESIAWKADASGYYTLSEKFGGIVPKLYFYTKI
jgi:hypothetical protein